MKSYLLTWSFATFLFLGQPHRPMSRPTKQRGGLVLQGNLLQVAPRKVFPCVHGAA